jgi:cytochrome P450
LPEIVLTAYDEIREALYNRDLTRSLDERSFEEGNPRAGVLSMLHGNEHKVRRRLENPLFRRSELVEYEQDLFPVAIDAIAQRDATGAVDLLELAGTMATVLACRRAGIDHDGSREQLTDLFRIGLALAQGAALADALVNRDTVRRETEATLERLEERFVGPSRRTRQELIERSRNDADVVLPYDLITAALLARDSEGDALDDALLTREVGLYLHGGSHTSAQTTCNAFEFLLGLDGTDRSALLKEAAASTLAAQRIVHETLRVVPMTPRVQRRAVIDTVVAGRPLEAGATLVLDVRAGNRDERYFGPDSDRFDPDRPVREGAAKWGLSFGAGPHICIGRSVAGGMPLHGEEGADELGDGHLYGQVARMVQAIAARGLGPDPANAPERDDRTTRSSARWRTFPVVFPAGGTDTPTA